jgi:hypothetical protein
MTDIIEDHRTKTCRKILMGKLKRLCREQWHNISLDDYARYAAGELLCELEVLDNDDAQ